MIQSDSDITPQKLLPKIERLFELSARKIRVIAKVWDEAKGTPVFTIRGIYTSRGWTEWTQGFQFGSALLQFDATGEKWFLEYGRKKTVEVMASHVSHIGVHDHGFNNVSTYGNLLRLMREGRIPVNPNERNFYELALKVSGAVQAARWSRIRDGRGYIHSFNGPHSLFADTIRSLRSLALAHRLGHVLMGEMDRRISLLERLLQHAEVAAQYAVYYGEGRDHYDIRGRVAHESIFNMADGNYRCPNSQQGYSPFSTWTRGLAWMMCGYAEELEFLETLPDHELAPFGGRRKIEATLAKAAEATCDFYMANVTTDGIPFWDTGAPGLQRLGNCLEKPSDPFNDEEPVDSSAAAIAAQGLWRFGAWLEKRKRLKDGARYRQAALVTANTLFGDPYLSAAPSHHGLILHSVYHRPNGWDYIPPGRKIPCGESSMWGDYHARELALLLLREARRKSYLAFFNIKE
ncbi:MAG: glycoside hydrolase family 88 protein [Verrucomicrobia bacterium]|nr:glycoside hydrolase family 88 protein [Verrucomicrobiota bacterium]